MYKKTLAAINAHMPFAKRFYKSKRVILYTLIILSSSSTCFGAAFEYRQEIALQKDLVEKWAFVFITQERWRRVFSNLVQHLQTVGIQYSPNNEWVLGLFYRHDVRQFDSGWESNPETLIDLTRTWTCSSLTILNRSRFQIRYGHADWRYRNRITLRHPIKKPCDTNLVFQLSNEWFFHELRLYDQNRFGVGLALPFEQNCSEFRVLYVMQHNYSKGIGWVHERNILRIEAALEF